MSNFRFFIFIVISVLQWMIGVYCIVWNYEFKLKYPFVINIFIFDLWSKSILNFNFKSDFQRNKTKKYKINSQSGWKSLSSSYLLKYLYYTYTILWLVYNCEITNLLKCFIKSSFFLWNYFLTHYRLKCLNNLSVNWKKVGYGDCVLLFFLRLGYL